MCGIFGVVHLDGRPARMSEIGSVLRAGAKRMAHRGPDDERLHCRDNVGFAFRRLSIVDLKEGAQPFVNENGDVALMANGEIYNHREIRAGLKGPHRFSSASDCEVLLHAFEEDGIESIKRTNGMFALAIHDSRARKLYLVRDRMGIKPLFFWRGQKRLVFGSEIKSLFAHPDVPRHVDWQSALAPQAFFSRTVQKRPLPSFFRDIQVLPPGHFMQVDLVSGEIEITRYWKVEQCIDDDGDLNADSFVQRVRAHFEDAVRLRLMADVECGIFLSGGLDSVAIAAAAQKDIGRIGRPFHSFSVLSQSTFGNGDTEASLRASQAFGIPNHQALFDWRRISLSPADWKRILWHVETPWCQAEMLYKFFLHGFAKRCRPDLKVILLGQGSDELFGGYTRVLQGAVGDDCGDWDGFMAALRRRQGVCDANDAGLPVSVINVGDPVRHPMRSAFIDEALHDDRVQDPWLLHRKAYERSLPSYNLWHEDKTASAFGIENRVPFLDHRLVEDAYAVPRRLWNELFFDKNIVRRAMRDLVPDLWCRREKVPFFDGKDERYTQRMMYELLCAERGALVDEAIALAPDVIDPDQLRTLINEIPDDPEFSAVEQVFPLVNAALLSGLLGESAAPAAHTSTPVYEVAAHPADTAQDVEVRWQEIKVRVAEAFDLDEGATRNVPVDFAPEVALVHCQAGTRGYADLGHHYLLVGGRMEYLLDKDTRSWVDFLKHVDGQRSVDAIVQEYGLDKDEVAKNLEEALSQGILCLRQPNQPAL